MLRPGAGFVQHCQPAARGMLSFLSLLRAFLLNAIKRDQASEGFGWRPSENFCVIRNPNPVVRSARLDDLPIYS